MKLYGIASRANFRGLSYWRRPKKSRRLSSRNLSRTKWRKQALANHHARAGVCVTLLETKGDDSVHLIKVRLVKLVGCLRDCVAVAKHPQNTAQRSGSTRYDERYIISLTFTIKIITLLFGVHAFNAVQEAAPGSGSLEVWNRWDSLAYLNVARHGYTNMGPDRVQLVMFPLYPFCVHAFAVIARNYLISAFVVSGVAATVAAMLLYKLTRLDNSRATALKAVWLMLIFLLVSFCISRMPSHSSSP